jgi:hypothetical protein
VSKSEAVFVKEKRADITFFAVVRNTCTKSEMSPRLSEFYECSGTQIFAIAIIKLTQWTLKKSSQVGSQRKKWQNMTS